MRRLLFLLLLAGAVRAQNPPVPLQIARQYNITSAAEVQDNRSLVSRSCNYHSFTSTGTGDWSVQMEWSDTSTSGPWTSFGATGIVTSASDPPIGAANGYHKWIRFHTLAGTTSVNYSCEKDFFISAAKGGSGGTGCGGDNPACTIPEGGTSAITATAATHNLQFLSPYAGGAARPDDEKMNDTVSVLDLHADPTGLADSSAAFQAALNAVATRAGAGVRAYVPCGVYKLNSTVNISKIQQSLVGENQSCVTLQYQGTIGAIQFVMAPESGGDAGELGNFTIQLPNAVAGTYGVWQHTSGAWVHDIQITQCLAATGFKIDNGLTNNAGGVSYLEHNLWTNLKGDRCAIGYRLSDGGVTPAPTYMYMGYNYFDSVSAYLSLGQVGFQLDAGPMFYNSILNLSCKVDNLSTSGTSACIKSSGFWDQNTTTLTGEYNDSGTGTGSVYPVWVTSTGKFGNIGGAIAVNRLVPGSMGPLLPSRIDAGGTLNAPSTVIIGPSSTQPACGAFTPNRAWIVQGGAGVADTFQICQKDAAGNYAWVSNSGGTIGPNPTFSGLVTASGYAEASSIITSNYTTTAADSMLYCDASAGAITVTLSNTVKGRPYKVQKIDTSVNTCTVTPASGTISGQASIVLASQSAIAKAERDQNGNWWLQ